MEYTIKEYCAIVGVKQPAISYRITRQKPIPGIVKVKEVDGGYVLVATEKVCKKLREQFNSRRA